MSPKRLRDNWPELVDVWETGNPVFVVGPGCDRIDFDKGPAWSEVAERVRQLWKICDERRDFLTEFWVRKHSAARQTREAIVADLERAEPLTPYARDPWFDNVRTLGLAQPVLEVLATCTELIGRVIAQGDVPVGDWDSVAVPISKPLQQQREEAAGVLHALENRCHGLRAWTDGRDIEHEDERDALDELNFEDAPAGVASRPAKRRLEILNVLGIAKTAGWLHRNCVKPAEGLENPLELTGAAIEWLGDLLWHVLVADSAVPPSQAELAFYINLAATAQEPVTPRTFSRPQSGEFRGDDPARLPDFVCNRLEYVANGRRPDLGTDRRHALAQTVALTLREQWKAVQRGRLGGHVPVALVAGYGLILERYLFAASGEGEVFHILVPAKADGTHTWLWGTCTAEGPKEPRDLARLRGALSWAPYDAKGPASLAGPIIVKLNGSPYLELSTNDRESAGIRESDLFRKAMPTRDSGGYATGSRDRWVEQLAVFAEQDAMRAVMALRRPASHQKPEDAGVAYQVLRALTWQRRSWLFLGDRFPDWIPRLRLLLSAEDEHLGQQLHAPNEADGSAGGGRLLQQGGFGVRPRRLAAGAETSAPEPQSAGPSPPDLAPVRKKIAIDRSFDWPERALLESLQIEAWLGDLGSLATLPEALHGDLLHKVQLRMTLGD